MAENVPRYARVYEVYRKLYGANRELFKELGEIIMVICLPQGVRSCGRFALFMGKFFSAIRKKGRPVSCQQQENAFLQIPILHCSKGPKVSKGRPESPLVASAEAKPFVIREKER